MGLLTHEIYNTTNVYFKQAVHTVVVGVKAVRSRNEIQRLAQEKTVWKTQVFRLVRYST